VKFRRLSSAALVGVGDRMEKERGWSTGGISFILIIFWREDGEEQGWSRCGISCLHFGVINMSPLPALPRSRPASTSFIAFALNNPSSSSSEEEDACTASTLHSAAIY
jgi:hypothetical protein